ncbi:MAG TPA: hypothetical protein VMX35_13690 [Acidobacteriota bacterium]|nr:hypothetical protein [Acidobacteriota bacterium]
MKNIMVLSVAVLMLLPLTAAAQDDYVPLKMGSISFRIGGFWPNADSDLWETNFADLTIEKADFNSYMVGVEFNWFASRLITVGVAIDYYKKTNSSNYIDYTDMEGNELYQDITLELVPMTATVKLTPLGNGSPGYRGGRGSSIVPWVGGGVGIYSYRYEEFGEFIDFSDMSIIEGDFITEDVAFGFHVAGGVVVPVGFDWDAFGEVRYSVVKGDLSEDFLGFEPLDLGGLTAMFGVSYRF